MSDNIDSKKMPKSLQSGDRIKCKTIKELRSVALLLASEGYGVAVLGTSDIFDNVLTITMEPKGRRA